MGDKDFVKEIFDMKSRAVQIVGVAVHYSPLDQKAIVVAATSMNTLYFPDSRKQVELLPAAKTLEIPFEGMNQVYLEEANAKSQGKMTMLCLLRMRGSDWLLLYSFDHCRLVFKNLAPICSEDSSAKALEKYKL